MMNAVVAVEISIGELLDKITILEIKAAQITSAEKLANVTRELQILQSARANALATNDELHNLEHQLKAVNLQLWQIEDDIRDCERQQIFSERFIELARAVYKINDQRAHIKRLINEKTGSHIVEEKSYQPY
ncbi:MAG: DUF6165 family protein [Alphaproteobacteria bacterium]